MDRWDLKVILSPHCYRFFSLDKKILFFFHVPGIYRLIYSFFSNFSFWNSWREMMPANQHLNTERLQCLYQQMKLFRDIRDRRLKFYITLVSIWKISYNLWAFNDWMENINYNKNRILTVFTMTIQNRDLCCI